MKIIFVFYFLFALPSSFLFKQKVLLDIFFQQSTVSVEDVKMIKEFNNAWTVKGKVRNKTSKPIKGAVKIKFVNSKGDIVHTTRAYVNDDDPFGPGQAAIFSYSTTPANFDDVVRYIVDFYQR